MAGSHSGFNDVSDPAAPSAGRRIFGTLRTIAIGFVGTLAALALLAAALYFFGGPTGPSREVREAYAELEAAGSVPTPPDPQFVVPIPGCRCHSDDPVQIVFHAEYRIGDCARCH